MYVYTYGNKKPIISIIGCIHGDEPSGKKIINRLKNYLSINSKNITGTIKLIIANEKALKKDNRYIDKDLNRSFPGKKDSRVYEEKLAFKLVKELKNSKSIIKIFNHTI